MLWKKKTILLVLVLALGTAIGVARASQGDIPLTVATVCMNAKTDTAANLETFSSYIIEASEKGAVLIVFPEIALQQNPGWGGSSYIPTEAELKYVHDTAETIPGPSTEVLVQIAREHNIAVIFGMTEKSQTGALYNTSVFLGPRGVLGKHRKKRLWDSGTGGNEHRFWTPGSDDGLVDSPLGRIGLIICIEMYHLLGLERSNAGADFLVTVSAWTSSSGNYYETYTKRNAAESGRWHIVANQVGTVGHATDYGRSRIIDPNGVVVADTGAQEGMVIHTIGYLDLTSSADLNGDGMVDSADICIVVDHWGTDESLCDIGPMPWGDGIVDVQDLIVLAEHLFEEVDKPLLVAHWALDEAEGRIAYDSAGTCDGRLLGNPLWQPAGGMVNGALQFDGVDDFIFISSILNSIKGPFSVFAWIKGGGLGQVVIAQTDRVNWLCADSLEGNLMTELKGTGQSVAILPSQAVITDGDWHRIGFVWDGSYRTLYVDNVAVAEDTQDNLEVSENRLYIGAGKDREAGTYWSGLIDDVRIYNRAVIP